MLIVKKEQQTNSKNNKWNNLAHNLPGKKVKNNYLNKNHMYYKLFKKICEC